MRAGWQTRISIRGKNLGEQRSFSRGRGLPVKGKGGYEEDAVAVLDNLSGVMAVRYAAHEFKAQKATGDHLGFHHVRIMQLHQGLKVVGGDLIVHFNAADDPYQVNGSYVPGIEVDLVPQIDAAAAEQIAIKNLSTLDEELDHVAGAPELVVFARDRAPVLAYELALTSTPSGNQAPGLWRYWIDAVTGEVVSRYNDIKDIAAPTGNGANAAISGNILLGEGGGVKTVTGWYENTDNYYLYNKINHWYIYNVSADDVLYPDAETYAYRPSNDWKNTDRTEMSGAVCLDATQLYFKNVHGRSSYNNANAYARANVHEGIYYVNAFWDPARQQFFFGDGDGGTADSLVVMDVVAHEFTHAVTENTADLVYAYEPGALNESFSDIFGACVEFATQPDG
jgi:Zn-dependent metalloprotease